MMALSKCFRTPNMMTALLWRRSSYSETTTAPTVPLNPRKVKRVFGADGLEITSRYKERDKKSAFFYDKKRAVDDDEIETLSETLPQGVSMKDLPKFERIQPWDKGNSKLKYLRNVFHKIGKSDRTAGKIIVIEGKRLLTDAIRAGFYPKTMVFSRLNCLISLDPEKPLDLVQVGYKRIKEWSDLSTPPGLMAAFDKDEIIEGVKENPESLPITLVLDNVRGPDNMGAILRSAAAVGCRRVVATTGCVDVWKNSKVLRAAAGAHFHIPIATDVRWDVIHRHLPKYPQVALADILRTDNESLLINETVIAKTIEDLTVKSHEFRDDDPEEDDYKDGSFFEEDLLAEYRNLPLKTLEYWKFRPDQRELVLVIGGETHGISDQSYKLVHDYHGERLYIPLKNGMESLNVVSAASIILFQIQQAILKSSESE